MKNHWTADKSNSQYWRWKNDEMVKVPGFSGYYISRFLDIVSFRSPEGNVVKTHQSKNGKYTLWCVQLFDDNGKRRLLSVKKLYNRVLGAEEYTRRVKLRGVREDVVRQEEEARDKAYEEMCAASEKVFQQQCALRELY